MSLLQLDVQNGLVFTNDIKNQSDPNSGFGAYYSTNRFYAGFSISNLLENNFSEITQLTDEDGKLQKYGPFTDDKVTVPIKSIMVDKLRGNYIATLTAKMKIGKTLMRQTKLHLEVAVAPKVEEVMRFSIIFEFDDAKSIAINEKYLTEIVTPKIPIGGKVIIRGFTDIIGETDHNQRLSLSRANDVRKIMETSLTKAGRTDVTFEVAGFGEDEKTSPFENKLPEERFYNRTVIIDIEK